MHFKNPRSATEYLATVCAKNIYIATYVCMYVCTHEHMHVPLLEMGSGDRLTEGFCVSVAVL